MVHSLRVGFCLALVWRWHQYPPPPCALRIDEHAWVHALPDCEFHSSSSVIEVCSGLGGFSKEAARLGLQVLCGVDCNKAWSPLFSALHKGASLVVGDLSDLHVASSLAAKGGFYATLLSGIACQPHSKLGDKGGMSDCRGGVTAQDLEFGLEFSVSQ